MDIAAHFRARGEHGDGQGSSLSRAVKGATFMLLTVSFVFIVLTAPLSTLTALNRKGNIFLCYAVAFDSSFAMRDQN